MKRSEIRTLLNAVVGRSRYAAEKSKSVEK
jgi:hypothetical protein